MVTIISFLTQKLAISMEILKWLTIEVDAFIFWLEIKGGYMHMSGTYQSHLSSPPFSLVFENRSISTNSLDYLTRRGTHSQLAIYIHKDMTAAELY